MRRWLLMNLFGMMILVLTGCTSSSIPDELIFAGRVVNEGTGEWPNNRLVLIFVRDKEVARGLTALGEFVNSGQGVHDGLYAIRVPNTYKLSMQELNRDLKEDQRFHYAAIRAGLTEKDPWKVIRTYGYQWFHTAPEGQTYRFPVKAKNITYVLKILPGEVSSLPESLRIPGSARLKSENDIVVALNSDPTSSTEAVGDDSQSRALIDGMSYDGIAKTVPVNKITVPINNCGGSAKIIQEYTQTQVFVHEYRAEVGGSLGLGIPLPFNLLNLQLELQAKYGFEQGQVASRTISYHMEAEPGTNQIYVITWQEVWDTGTAQTITGADTITVPFQVKTNLIYEVNSSKLPCN